MKISSGYIKVRPPCGQVLVQHSAFILKVIEKGVCFSPQGVYYFLELKDLLPRKQIKRLSKSLGFSCGMGWGLQPLLG